MDRLHLNPGEPKDSTTPRSRRSGSRRDVLPFPKGGVFGLVEGGPDHVERALDRAREVEYTLSRLQSRIDELSAELDDPYLFPLAKLSACPHDSRPAA